MRLFTAEDFRYLDHEDLEYMAELANQKLQKLIDESPVVYKYRNGSDDASKADWSPEKDDNYNYSRKARLMFIDEIVKEPKPITLSIETISFNLDKFDTNGTYNKNNKTYTIVRDGSYIADDIYKVPSYPLEVEWIYEGMGEIGRRGIMFSWCYIQWKGESNFSYYGEHIFKIIDKRVVEFLNE